MTQHPSAYWRPSRQGLGADQIFSMPSNYVASGSFDVGDLGKPPANATPIRFTGGTGSRDQWKKDISDAIILTAEVLEARKRDAQPPPPPSQLPPVVKQTGIWTAVGLAGVAALLYVTLRK